MRVLHTTLVLFASVLVTSATEARKEKTPQEAEPIVAMLEAVKTSDVKAFRNTYCERIRDDNMQGDWDRNLKEARDNIKTLYGDYDLKEFTYAFVGDAERGKVSIIRKRNKSLAIAVIKEGGTWKIDER